MGEPHILTLLLTVRIAIQAMMLWFVVDSYKNTKVTHAIYAGAAYGMILLAWCFDAILYFDIIRTTSLTVFLQDGVLPLLIAISLLILAVSSKKRRNVWIQQ